MPYAAEPDVDGGHDEASAEKHPDHGHDRDQSDAHGGGAEPGMHDPDARQEEPRPPQREKHAGTRDERRIPGREHTERGDDQHHLGDGRRAGGDLIGRRGGKIHASELSPRHQRAERDHQDPQRATTPSRRGYRRPPLGQLAPNHLAVLRSARRKIAEPRRQHEGTGTTRTPKNAVNGERSLRATHQREQVAGFGVDRGDP